MRANRRIEPAADTIQCESVNCFLRIESTIHRLFTDLFYEDLSDPAALHFDYFKAVPATLEEV